MAKAMEGERKVVESRKREDEHLAKQVEECDKRRRAEESWRSEVAQGLGMESSGDVPRIVSVGSQSGSSRDPPPTALPIDDDGAEETVEEREAKQLHVAGLEVNQIRSRSEASSLATPRFGEHLMRARVLTARVETPQLADHRMHARACTARVTTP